MCREAERVPELAPPQRAQDEQKLLDVIDTLMREIVILEMEMKSEASKD